MTFEQSDKLDIIASYMGHPLTDEQKEFASDFTRDTISFSDPGTGKTHTLIAGLVMVQRFHKIPGKSINCISFTQDATTEMAGRYNALCDKCMVSPTVTFNTFHRLSRQILTSAYPGMVVHDDAGTTIKQDVEDLTAYMRDRGFQVGDEDTKYVRKVLKAITSLNSAMTFHPANIAERYAFVDLGMDIEDFQQLRASMFRRGLITKSINVGDIPMYCLYALMRKEEVVREWKGKFKIMVVDEFQDLSLMHLNILSYIAETLIVIGDMKQQIYQFNGACPQIVAEYLRMRPNARVCNLTQSFRCGQEIADFATRIIKPNDSSVQCFGGHKRGANVSVIRRRDLDWKDVVGRISADKRVNGYAKMRDVMFLYRNNASAIPIIEELYKNKIPYRCPKMAKVMDIPIFSTLSKLCDAAWQPNNPDMCATALRVFPEFRFTPYGQTPAPVMAMKASGKDLFSLSYRYKEQSSTDILNAMYAVKSVIDSNKSAGVAYMKLMEVYGKYLHRLEWWKVENDKEFYFNLVAPICNSKPYPLMYNEELDKEMENQKAIKANFGIRCYTMHSSKGLEADDVYILDCDEGKFPNVKVMNNEVHAGCLVDVANSIRSERNLLYVAITRAKDNVIISYSGEQPALLLSDPDNKEYGQYDKYYNPDVSEFNDADEFFKLFKIGGYAVDAGKA